MAKYKIESVLTLAMVFSLWYGMAETYVWFARGIYTLDIQSVLGISNKIALLLLFSMSILTIFNEVRMDIWTIGLSGMLSVFLKDLFYRMLLMLFLGTLEMFSGIYLIQLIFDNFMFGIPFMLASYLVMGRRMK